MKNLVHQSPKKKRFRNIQQDPKCQTAINICDIVMLELIDRFSFSSHLYLLAKLFHSDKFNKYNTDFPKDILKTVKGSYSFINHLKLQTEFEVIYYREDFHNCEGCNTMGQEHL